MILFPDHKQSEDGFALPVVLGFLFVVALSVTPFLVQARLSLQASHYRMTSDGLERLAKGIIHVVAHKLVAGEAETFKSGAHRTCTTSRHAFSLTVQDHRGLIDVNAAGTDLLRIGFVALGLGEADARASAKAIAQSRIIQRNVGQFDDDAWHIERQPQLFNHVLELTDLKSLDGISPRAIASVFTVHTKSGQTVKGLAPPSVRTVLEGLPGGFDEQPAINNIHRSGVFTMGISARDLVSDITVSSTYVVALNLRGNPVQFITSIPGFGSSAAPVEASESCSEILSPNVTLALEAFEGA